jgi:RecB family endonuclease NucS
MKIAEHGWRYGRCRRRFRRYSTKFLGDAFDAVIGMLHGTNYPDGVREVLADRVIEFGRTTSERDPQRLARAVLASLGIKF